MIDNMQSFGHIGVRSVELPGFAAGGACPRILCALGRRPNQIECTRLEDCRVKLQDVHCEVCMFGPIQSDLFVSHTASFEGLGHRMCATKQRQASYLCHSHHLLRKNNILSSEENEACPSSCGVLARVHPDPHRAGIDSQDSPTKFRGAEATPPGRHMHLGCVGHGSGDERRRRVWWASVVGQSTTAAWGDVWWLRANR